MPGGRLAGLGATRDFHHGLLERMALDQVLDDLQREAGVARLGEVRAVGGGGINRAFRVESGAGPVFVKVNTRQGADMFAAEAAGLEAIREARAVATPVVVALGETREHAWLALEWIDFVANAQPAAERLGRELAAMHAVTGEHFGWHRDNTIGSTPQPNTPTEKWIDFWRDHRLGHQLELAVRKGLPGDSERRVTALLGGLDQYFDGYRPESSLLHGDLWGGNWGATRDGTPYIYDPAVYFGDREADLAMTRLFGGFGEKFYEAYQAVWPLAPGWERRVALYNLYHLVNHFNLFGTGYLGRIEDVLRELGR